MAMPPRDSNLGWYQSTKARKAALRVFLLLVKFSPSIADHCTYPRSLSLLPPPSAEHHADLPLPPSSKADLPRTAHCAPLCLTRVRRTIPAFFITDLSCVARSFPAPSEIHFHFARLARTVYPGSDQQGTGKSGTATFQFLLLTTMSDRDAMAFLDEYASEGDTSESEFSDDPDSYEAQVRAVDRRDFPADTVAQMEAEHTGAAAQYRRSMRQAASSAVLQGLIRSTSPMPSAPTPPQEFPPLRAQPSAPAVTEFSRAATPPFIPFSEDRSLPGTHEPTPLPSFPVASTSVPQHPPFYRAATPLFLPGSRDPTLYLFPGTRDPTPFLSNSIVPTPTLQSSDTRDSAAISSSSRQDSSRTTTHPPPTSSEPAPKRRRIQADVSKFLDMEAEDGDDEDADDEVADDDGQADFDFLDDTEEPLPEAPRLYAKEEPEEDLHAIAEALRERDRAQRQREYPAELSQDDVSPHDHLPGALVELHDLHPALEP
ncbi:hypothetical protein DFH07DRAFT_952437 [Mycena maculata]|uniref:Uncharacterized protein n=1 Tax=Mycena maculata TaxID=230809 RepID=A0AAD7JXU5_9AGAR|nr:hypothetical protein DFH07DRAFT_952437 [Mycena maculata]